MDNIDALVAGHIKVYPGTYTPPPFCWSRIFEGKIRKGYLSIPRFFPKISREFDYYSFRGPLPLHTDDTVYSSSNLSMGFIIEAKPDLMLTTGRNKIPAKVGDVFTLDPRLDHGARTSGIVTFLVEDYDKDNAPSPDEFRLKAIADLEQYVKSWTKAIAEGHIAD